MPERTSYLVGEPCWVDIQTPDPETTQHFYGALFGWTFRGAGPEFGGYVTCSLAGQPVAGIISPQPGSPVAQASWSVYLASDDASGTASRVERAGGKIVMPVTEVPTQGRMLLAVDPTGATFGAWQATGHAGSALEGEPGAPTWTELKTRDGAAADAFYQALFPYQQQQVGDGESFDYTVWSIDGTQVCGRHRLSAEIGDEVPPHWMVYFAVDDADVAAQTIVAAGGQLRQGPQDSPYGRLVVAVDPGGALFSVIDISRKPA